MNSIDDLVKWLWLMIPLFISPGPANIAIASISSRFGFKAVMPFIGGLLVVDLIVTPLMGIGCGAIFTQQPYLFHIRESCGVAYIFYLSYKILITKSSGESSTNNHKSNFGFKSGIILQILNAKFIAMIIMLFMQFL